VFHLNAPIVFVKAETKDGKPVLGLAVSADYTQQETNPSQEKHILEGGVRSDVVFEKLKDGRFRSWQLQPELELSVTATAPGFKPASHELTLTEAQTEQIDFVLEPE
jgi:hypothetical protein